jgi:hypothetical protein
MRQVRLSHWAVVALLAGPAAALAAEAPAQGPGPCEQIVAACKSAGFIEGDYKTGKGLHLDCIDPIMQGAPQPSIAKIPLPKVSPETVAACKQRHPNFGEPKSGEGKPGAPKPGAEKPQS